VNRLEGRTAIVTGAGRGIGREHARALASEGAAVIVNDLGTKVDGNGTESELADRVCKEICSSGGAAIPSRHDVSDWHQANQLIDLAISSFGGLDILVNNAGILRDRAFFNMSEDEWDAVITVHLKGHAAPSRHAMAYWRTESKAGRSRSASIIHTTSSSGLCGNFGQVNYGAAKMGIVGLSKVLSIEGIKYGVRSNVISPAARTRMTDRQAGAEILGEPDETGYDPYGAEHIAVVASWLAEADCPANNQVLHVSGRRVSVLEIPRISYEVRSELADWTPEGLNEALIDGLVSPLGASELILGREF